MNLFRTWRRPHVAIALLALLSLAAYAAESALTIPTQEQADKAMDEGNIKDALEAYTQRLQSLDTAGSELADDLPRAVECLQRLNRLAEFDTLVESAVDAHSDDWRLLAAAAESFQSVPHYGYLISGHFERGQHRGGGKVMHATERDGVRGLQLLNRAMKLVEADPKATDKEKARIARQLAGTLLSNRSGSQGWQLQMLTDLETLPDYEDGWGHQGGNQGAPVTAENKPVFHDLPSSWADAKSDGERWRWALEKMAQLDPSLRYVELTTRASFLRSQFGVITLGNSIQPLIARNDEDSVSNETSLYALHTLKENETLARLATGIQRFELPDEYNFVLLYKRALEEGQESTNRGRVYQASSTLARLFSDRRQYPRSAEFWRLALENAGSKPQRKQAQESIDQIEKPWGQFETTRSQPSGSGASFEFRYRNAESVEFTAHAIDVPKLLADVKEHLKSNPKQLDWKQLNISDIGHRLVNEKQKKYIGDQTAKWSVELAPRESHFDRRTTITTPLQKAGAYLVTSNIAGGNRANIVLWVADTALVKKQMSDHTFYYVADAVTGKPIAKANLELFGYWYERPEPRQMKVHIKQYAELTDANGQVITPIIKDDQGHRFQWLSIATTPKGRLAYLGFHHVWGGSQNQQVYDHISAFSLTDRPVYRPGEQVHYKLWVGRAKYDAPMESEFAHKTFKLEIHDPIGELVESKQLTANAYGGVTGTFDLPDGATLGQYRLNLLNYGGGTFRVEEYKKPEFQVEIEAPKDPLQLGDKFEATVSARYYFGEPVREGTVKYKVLRTTRDAQWFPVGRWDWLYGRGYWWFSYDYTWYPGWNKWGCWAPHPWWIWRQPQPPEVVAEGESPLSEDGSLKIAIDTTLAKELHPDHDHEYRIEAEVMDRSRRTITGSGKVLVARKPFEVYAWTDRGYYRTGDTIMVNFQARRPDSEPVEGTGKVRLLSISYNDQGVPSETEIRTWELDTTSQGTAELQIKASEAGQYRLSYEVTKGDKTGEGGYLFTIVGEGFDGSNFRFADLELIPDQRHYAPGETVQLQLNTNRRGGYVLLFVRPENGVYGKPKMIHLEGKSTVVPIDVSLSDMPNMFIEAQTVSAGQVHTVAKQIVVPPAKRVINVEVAPSSPAYQPGQNAKVKIRLTDEQGKPVVGDTVLSVYDEALEYISGGTNVGDMRKNFWGWKRSHQPASEHNLDRYTANLTPRGQQAMQLLGAFGYLIDSELADGDRFTVLGRSRMNGFATGRKAGVTRYDGMPTPTSGPLQANETMRLSTVAEKGRFMKDKMMESAEAEREQGASGSEIQPTIRQQFADSAYWSASVETDISGIAEIEFPMPENLTKWKFGVWSMGQGVRVGDGSASAVTRKNLLVRLQTPRFLVERDEVVISANVHNYLPQAKQVKVRLELDGDYLAAAEGEQLETVVEIPAGGETRVDWRLSALHEGTAVLRALALTNEESDAMQLEVPVKVHGIEKLIPHSGVIASDATKQAFEITVPEQRRVGDTRLEVQFSPTLAGAMVDALPYLIEYPYGCTEQTLNRFLPAVLTQQTLRRMGVDLEQIREKQTNLNPQELGDSNERAEQWKRFKSNPVFSEEELDKVVKAGVNRLTEMQLSDGGWGWFSGYSEHSSAHTTAVVVRGLSIAKQNEVAIVPGVLEKGAQWLDKYQSEQLQKLNNRNADGSRKDEDKPYKAQADNLDALVYMVLVELQRADVSVAPEQNIRQMREHLYRDRTKLSVYSQSMFGLALQYQVELKVPGDIVAQRDMVARNLSQYVVQDDENQTAYLNLGGSYWWYWYGSEFEAHAYYLKLLAATDAQSETAAGLVKYLLNNRKHATYWNSTRDTALVVEAMSDYLKATGEGTGEMTVEVWLNGQRQKAVEITPDVLFSFDNRFVIEGGDIEAGRHTLEIRKTGQGRLYYNAYLSLFSLEDDIQAAGLEIKVARKYYKLTPIDADANVAGGRGQVVSQKIEKYERTEVPNLGVVESGDLVEIELTVESKNDYEYILLEDLKAAGFEPVEVRSGYNGNELGAYMELRDDRVSLFVRQLARGKHSVSYRMRAETPGKFAALPTKAYAMYAPELKANSNELKMHIVDQD